MVTLLYSKTKTANKMLSPPERINHIVLRFIEHGFSEAMRILEDNSLDIELNISITLKQLLGIFIEEYLLLLCGSEEVFFKKLCEDAIEEQLRMVTDYKTSTNGRIGMQAFLLTYDPKNKQWPEWQLITGDHERIILPLSKNQLQRLNWIDRPVGSLPIQRTRFIRPTVTVLRKYGWTPPSQEGSIIGISGIVPSENTVLLVNERGYTIWFHREYLKRLGWKPPVTERPDPEVRLITWLLVNFFGNLPGSSLLTVKEQTDLGLIPSDD
jgi:hypothetical protein